MGLFDNIFGRKKDSDKKETKPSLKELDPFSGDANDAGSAMQEAIKDSGVTMETPDSIEATSKKQDGLGVDDVVTGILHSIVGKDGTNKGQTGTALSTMGDFNVDSFNESNLKKAQGDSADGVATTIGSIMKLIGLTG